MLCVLCCAARAVSYWLRAVLHTLQVAFRRVHLTNYFLVQCVVVPACAVPSGVLLLFLTVLCVLCCAARAVSYWLRAVLHTLQVAFRRVHLTNYFLVHCTVVPACAVPSGVLLLFLTLLCVLCCAVLRHAAVHGAAHTAGALPPCAPHQRQPL